MSLYSDRDIEAQGQAYVKHVEAMTTEELHSKSDIAAELAHRDIEIERLQNEAKQALSDIASMAQNADADDEVAFTIYNMAHGSIGRL